GGVERARQLALTLPARLDGALRGDEPRDGQLVTLLEVDPIGRLGVGAAARGGLVGAQLRAQLVGLELRGSARGLRGECALDGGRLACAEAAQPARLFDRVANQRAAALDLGLELSDDATTLDE